MKPLIHKVYKHCRPQVLVQWILMKKSPKPTPAPPSCKSPVALAEYLASQAEVLAAHLQALAK